MSQFDQDIMSALVKIAKDQDVVTRPNPPAIAGMVQNGALVAFGQHGGPGTPHAEADLLRKVGDRARGGTVYVTLEPCTHWGANPPCCDALIQAGVSRVVYPFEDPNPLVRNRSAQTIFESAGIQVTIGIGKTECILLNREFLTHIQYNRPYIIGKVAISLDGKIALSNGVSRYISGPQSLDKVHCIRSACDGILVGVNTVLADNPSLSVRRGAKSNPNYKKIILDSYAKTPPGATLFRHTAKENIVILVGSDAPQPNLDQLSAHASIIQLPVPSLQNQWQFIMKAIYQLGVYRLLIEGGSQVMTSAIQSGMIDELVLIQSPILIGGNGQYGFYTAPTPTQLSDSIRLHEINRELVGDDQIITGFLNPILSLIQNQGA